MKLLNNKTVIVTGGSRGIGKSIVLKLAEHGANVVFTYLSSSKEAAMVVEDAKKYDTKIIALKSDASNYIDCENLVEDILKEFNSIDVLVNNAGITKDNLLLRMTEDDFDKVLNVNMKSVFNMTKVIQKTMLKSRKGSIINLGSIVGSKGNAGQANYSASKAAIVGFSKSIALELGSRNIRCNVIAPGFIETEMTEHLNQEIAQEWKKNIPLKRAGSGFDVANLVLFLASDLSSYISGQVISVCGGMST
ncbi:MAG: 3-oxoacyl-[acyl-carrier-protein] reductase [Flavobacteriales bacterium]|nr:3-oxoacyl-[acyl-carrier-protein] reductase [Flavobacteriales bacterium]|tara:strand:+ start:5628 stop:6374 length:747 start_codon:yes stop_codon:yes gene_type:complete